MVYCELKKEKKKSDVNVKIIVHYSQSTISTNYGQSCVHILIDSNK